MNNNNCKTENKWGQKAKKNPPDQVPALFPPKKISLVQVAGPYQRNKKKTNKQTKRVQSVQSTCTFFNT